MLSRIFILTIISKCYAKIGHEKGIFDFKSARRLQNCGTNNMFHEYTTTAISAIGPQMEGQKVMITSKVSPNPLAACTMMLCLEDDLCCNNCNSDLLMGDFVLDSADLGCEGTNCDWDKNCTYQEGDVVAVQGVVSGGFITVDNHCLVGSQMGAMASCGELREGYTEVDVGSINADMIGEKVMMTSSVENSMMAACTRMACLEENVCCNSCHADSMFGEVYLIDSGGNKLGCQGTDCDWEDNCIYSSGDIVTVYGTVGGVGDLINVDDHCKIA